MDGDKFDQLTKSLTGGTSRRGLLRILGGSVLGGVLGAGGLSTATAACLDDCARRPTARARTICRRSCAQRGRTAPAQAQRGQSTSPQPQPGQGVFYPPQPGRSVPAQPQPGQSLEAQPQDCPPGRTRLANGTCALACSTFRDCPGSERGQAGGCDCRRFHAGDFAGYCVEGTGPGPQACTSTSQCPQGSACFGTGFPFSGSCEVAC